MQNNTVREWFMTTMPFSASVLSQNKSLLKNGSVDMQIKIRRWLLSKQNMYLLFNFTILQWRQPKLGRDSIAYGMYPIQVLMALWLINP